MDEINTESTHLFLIKTFSWIMTMKIIFKIEKSFHNHHIVLNQTYFYLCSCANFYVVDYFLY